MRIAHNPTTTFCAAASWLLIALPRSAHAQDTTTTVDDRDSAIQYSPGGWVPMTGGKQYGNSIMLSRTGGATASYSFTGTRISVFGTQGTSGGNTTVSTYSIDGSSPAQHTDDATTLEYQQPFYTSPTLADGQHTLLITNLHDGSWFWLDGFNVTAPTSSSASPPTSTSPSQSPTPLAASSHSITSTGAIVGITLAGVVLLALIVVGIWFWRKRRQAANEDGYSHIDRLAKPATARLSYGGVLPFDIERVVGSSIPPSTRRDVDEKVGLAMPRDSLAFNSLPNRPSQDGSGAFYSSSGGDRMTNTSFPGHSRYPSDATLQLSLSRQSQSGPDTRPRRVSLSKLRPPRRPPVTASSSGGRQHSADGGVRIAGGPSGSDHQGADGVDDGTMLPPAYRVY